MFILIISHISALFKLISELLQVALIVKLYLIKYLKCIW